jgi:hypothetical protein
VTYLIGTTKNARLNALQYFLQMPTKNCIAVLTRGYTDIREYDKLINRNNSINSNLKEKTTDIVIFHEGNILNDHQDYISDQTPSLHFVFVNVNNGYAFKKEKELIPWQDTYRGYIGYRHMCSFWFVDYLHFLNEYELVIRIDEDCIIYFSIDSAFSKLKNYSVGYGHTCADEDFVTIGLNNLTLNFIEEEFGIKGEGQKPGGPYTNLFMMNMNKIKKNDILMRYIKKVETTNCIYSHRWGDHPLWGEFISYFFSRIDHYQDKEYKYFHGSHNNVINN